MKSLDVLAKHLKADCLLFTEYAHADGVFVQKEGLSFTFTVDQTAMLDLEFYYLPYIKGKDEKFGVSLSNAKYWIIPLAGTWIICNQKKLLKSIFINDWDDKISNGIKYFIIPKDWLIKNCHVVKE
jgi:hypothetical protein